MADLGLARYKRHTFLSGAEGLRGTLPWMAPELVRSPGAVDERADVFAFGIVLWEIWAGAVPHQALDECAILAGLMNHKLRPPIACIEGGPSIPLPHPCWQGLMTDCWDEDPNRRPHFATVLGILERAKEGSGHACTYVR